MTPEIAQAQDAVVKALMEVPDVPWERIVVNWEIKDDGGEKHMGTIAFCISRNPEGGLTKTDMKNLPSIVPERLLALRELMARLQGDRWAGCDLAIDSNVLGTDVTPAVGIAAAFFCAFCPWNEATRRALSFLRAGTN